jgi:hypothetical protein
MKATRGAVEARVLELGATLVESGVRHYEALIEAPTGHVWRGSDLHELVIEQAEGEPRSRVWTDAMERMALGVEPCTNGACDWCASA